MNIKIYRNSPTDIQNDVSSRNRESRQQGGDTYTLEIAFPAVKYVQYNNKRKQKMNKQFLLKML